MSRTVRDPHDGSTDTSSTVSIMGLLCHLLICAFFATAAMAQQSATPIPQAGSISGTVIDVNDGVVPGATAVLDGPSPADHRSAIAGDSGFFSLANLKPGVPYRVTISADGFITWTSPTITLNPGQYFLLTGSRLQIAGNVASVIVVARPEEIAAEQVKIEEQQRIFGIIPNFYVTYDAHPAPLTAKMKFSLAYKTSIDPVTFVGVTIFSAADQAAGTPNYSGGFKGFGQRWGATYADGFTDIMLGGAILPSLLHQDPRYYYQGTGTNKSRALHALASPFVCRGDNGRREPNYSSVGGDLFSAAISNAYYPDSNRGVHLVVENVLIGSGERVAAALAQEFLLRRFTPRAKKQK